MPLCPVCGRETSVTIRGLCPSCFFKEYSALSFKNELKVCPTCGRIYVGRWEEFSLPKILSWVRRHLKVHPDIDVAQLNLSIKEEEDHFLVYASLQGRGFQHTETLKLKKKYEQCPYCARRYGGYYEAVIQLRGNRWRELYRKVLNVIEREKDPKAFITGEKQVKGGIDIYIGSKKVADRVGKRFKSLADEVKFSFSHVGEKDGKPITRKYVMIRLD